MSFSDKYGERTAVVTGAGSGIGRALSLALAGHGMSVVVADIEADQARAVAAEVEALGQRALAVEVDVASGESVNALAASAVAQFGSVAILCNNAGVSMRPFRTAWNTSPDDYRWIMDVNFHGVVNGVLAFVPRMRSDSGPRHVVNVCSMAALRTIQGAAAYVASKRAVEGLSEVLARELRPDGIGVTIVYPGAVRTRIAESERLRPEQDRSETRGVEAFDGQVMNPDTNPNPWKDPEEIAELVVAAIEEGRLYLPTHPVPEVDILERIGAIVGAPLGRAL